MTSPFRPRAAVGAASCLFALSLVTGCSTRDSATPGDSVTALGDTARLMGDSSAIAGGDVAESTTPPPANAPMQSVLDRLATLGGKPITTLAPEEARRQPTPTDAVMALLKEQGKSTAPEPVGSVANRTIPGPDGPLPVRIYTPSGAGPFPVVVYYHGGGWVIATIDTYDASARALTNAANAVLISVEYRKAPESKFPVAHDDAFAAYKWALANAGSIRGDSARVAVAGESAGGNLAAAVSIRARDEGIKLPVHQLLVYPVANYAFDSPSYVQNANAKPLNRPMMEWFFEQYLKSPSDGSNPMISLVRANLAGLPPTTIITAQIDPLRSDGEMLAERLRAAGVSVDHRNYEGVTHEFFGMGAVVDQAKEAQQFGAAGLKKGF